MNVFVFVENDCATIGMLRIYSLRFYTRKVFWFLFIRNPAQMRILIKRETIYLDLVTSVNRRCLKLTRPLYRLGLVCTAHLETIVAMTFIILLQPNYKKGFTFLESGE